MSENDWIMKAVAAAKIDPIMEATEAISFSENDAITDIMKRDNRKAKARRKPVSEWKGKDFLLFLDTELKPYGLRVDSMSQRDILLVNKLYDKFVLFLRDGMNNEILRSYIEWWVSVYAKNQSKNIPIYRLMGHFDIEKFMSRHNAPILPISTAKINPAPASTLDAPTIYATGGVPVLVMKLGIVRSCSYLNKVKPESFLGLVSMALKGFSKGVLESVMQNTISQSPYSSNELIDFISLARPALQFHGIKKYTSVNYRDFFEEK